MKGIFARVMVVVVTWQGNGRHPTRGLVPQVRDIHLLLIGPYASGTAATTINPASPVFHNIVDNQQQRAYTRQPNVPKESLTLFKQTRANHTITSAVHPISGIPGCKFLTAGIAKSSAAANPMVCDGQDYNF